MNTVSNRHQSQERGCRSASGGAEAGFDGRGRRRGPRQVGFDQVEFVFDPIEYGMLLVEQFDLPVESFQRPLPVVISASWASRPTGARYFTNQSRASGSEGWMSQTRHFYRRVRMGPGRLMGQ